MTIVVGASPTHQTRDSIHLAGMLARSAGTDLVIVAVVPSPWRGRAAREDQDYRNFLAARARASLTELGAVVPDDVSVRTLVRESESVSQGLVDAVREIDAPMLVLGSSTMGLLGRVGLGSVTERLLHSSPVPVAVAPRGFTAASDKRVTRVSIAYAVGPDETSLITTAAGVAHEVGASVRLVSFAVRPAGPITSGVGLNVEEDVIDTWAQGLRAASETLRDQVARLEGPPVQEEPVLGRGETWGRALEVVPWGRGDVLVVGSSRTARTARVFLGGTASKIARHSPVPVVVVPRPRPAG